MNFRKGLLLAIAASLPYGAYAGSTFSITTTANDQTVTKSYSKIDDLFDAAEQEGIASSIPSYTDMSAARSTLDIRGVTATTSYAANSSTLIFMVPSLGIDESFAGADRNASEAMFRDFIKRDGNEILSKMLRGMVESSPVDPVAGSPSSLLDSMAKDDFDTAVAAGTSRSQAENPSGFGIGGEGGHYSAGGNDISTYTIPLSYTHHFEKPGYHLKLTAPITYLDANGSKSLKGALGAALHIPVKDNWSLTPALRVGGVASKDMGSAAIATSASLTSVYGTKLGNTDVKIGNSLSLLKTNALSAGGYKIDYGLSNQILKNGISAKLPSKASLMGRDMDMEVSLANTQVMGDKVYIKSYNDLAFSMGSKDLRLGLTYTHGEHGYKGAKVNFGYDF